MTTRESWLTKTLARLEKCETALKQIKAKLPKRIPSGSPLGECLIEIALIVNAARAAREK